MSLLIQGPIAIGVALLLNRSLKGRGAFRLLIFVPYVLAEVIAGLAWKLLLQPTGAVNATLEAVGLGDLTRNWLADPGIALWTIFFILTWKYIGFGILLMLAGLQGVPDELSEAAQIDGATWWQVQRYITIPLLAPTIRIWAFLSIIGSLQVFDMVWVTVSPTVRGIATETMATYMVQQGQFAGQPGYGSAIAVILFLISLVDRSRLPALRPAPRSRGRRHHRGALMSATTTIVTGGARRPDEPAPAAHAGRGFDWGQPFVYLVALVIVAVAIGPVLYVFIGGFRTTADLNANPAGMPDPWTVQNWIDGADGAALLGQRPRVDDPRRRDHRRRRDRGHHGRVRARALQLPRPQRAVHACSRRA